MKPSTHKLLPAVVFVVCLLVTAGIRKAGTSAKHAESGNPPSALAEKSRHREEDAFARLRAFLRAGDLAGARRCLSELGARDPEAFFELLEKLPGIPGIEDLIEETAARLEWDHPRITALLNRIGPPQWRYQAWEAYTFARVGKLPDEEIFLLGSNADTQLSQGGVRRLMEDAAEKRTDSFLALLNKLGGTSVREEFFEMLMKHHPERADELFDTIPDHSWGCNYDRAYVLQVRARCLPTAENLASTLADVGENGSSSGDFAPLFTYQTYSHATPEEKAKVLELIVQQPALARNRMIHGPMFYGDAPVPADEFVNLVGLYTSAQLQRQALERWMEEQPELDPSARSWVEQLPTGKLKQRATELLDEKAAKAK
ncbi:hypothetical protein [Luteolibacter luteus]|uniref:HEAT repeat domain-containing protein n=1 Tax=Luteolibacter luteus TaxID=2728835 RepID=A0A858RGJ8_9BACT|nr:hypothetical protein [Luteolibacter luteus]QJE96276.1 hypothetical protein HHL09_10930 [Luteolibacter luteus]